MKFAINLMLMSLIIEKTMQNRANNYMASIKPQKELDKYGKPFPLALDFSDIGDVSSDAEIEAFLLRAFAAGFFSVPSPLGPIIGIITSVFTEVVIYYRRQERKSSPLVNVKYLAQTIYELQEFFYNESNRIIDEFKRIIYDQMLINKLRNSLNYLNDCHGGMCYLCFVENYCPSDIKNETIKLLTNPTSQYRTELSKLVHNFISTSKSPLNNAEKSMRIFDYMIWKHHVLKENNVNCNNTQSEQTKIYHMARYIILILTKSYTMVILANLEKYQNCIDRNDYPDARKWLYMTLKVMGDFYGDINSTLSAAQLAIDSSSRDIRPCDPKKHQRGVTYERLVHFIQADLWSGCFNDSQAFNCQSDFDINTVYSNPNDDERNVEYFAVDKGPTPFFIVIPFITKKYGKISDDKNLKWSRYIFNCGSRVCYTDQKMMNNTVRKFSLQEVKTSSENFVVTGVRLRLVNKVFYIQIQEGKLNLTGIHVEPGTVRWKKIEVSNRTVTLYKEQRSVSIDDVILPSGYFVTGVKFTMWGHLRLHVFGMNASGTKIAILHSILSDRDEIKLKNPDASELAPTEAQHYLQGVPGQSYVNFQASDFEKDASQTTVPYLDLQSVITKPPSPIGGVGIYYKGLDGYGGFIGLKLISLDLTEEIKQLEFSRLSNSIDNVLVNLSKALTNISQVQDEYLLNHRKN